MKKDTSQLILPVIIAIAAALRLAGIAHDFPLVIHPDEPAVIRTALGLRFYLNPGHFDWPHLYMYLNYGLYMVFAYLRNLAVTLDLKRYIAPVVPLIWNDSLIFYLLTRIFSALLGAATVIPIYLAGKENFGRRVGLLAALTFCFIPYHVDQSHYALVDVPMTFFVAWGMYFALKILVREDKHEYAGAGFYIGLAASTKYNGGLSLFTIPLAHLIRTIKNREKLLRWRALGALSLACLTALLGFLIGTPYALLDFGTFSRSDNAKGAFWQFRNVGSVTFREHLLQLYNQITSGVLSDLGYTIMVGFLIVLVLLIIRVFAKKKSDANTALWFLVITVLFILYYVSGFLVVRSRYFIFSYPYIALVFGYLLNSFFEIFRNKYKLLGFSLFVLFLSVPTYLSIRIAYVFTQPDTRTSVYNWLKTNSSPTDVIVFNDPQLPGVMGALPNKRLFGLDKLTYGTPAYLVYSFDDEPPAQFDALHRSGALKEISVFDNTMRLGPDIIIYSLNK